jgi:hypothetical protein
LELFIFVMDRHQQDFRQAADKAFIESLDELGKILQPQTTSSPTSASNKRNQAKQPPPAAKPPLDLDAFAEAAADIEAFMEQQSKEE